MLYYISSYSFKLLCSLRCSYALYCSNALTLSIVFSIMTLFSAVYASSIFKLLFLLWRSLKHFSLLKSVVWLFLLLLLFIRTLIFWFLRPFIAVHMLSLLCTAKIYWLWIFVSLSWYLLWCLSH